MVKRLGLIADDLTGACDAGVQFAQRGLTTLVWLDPEPREPAEVTVITTNSRNDAPEVARRKVEAACRALPQLIFKKVDSTLYGNIVAEIEAALDASGSAEAWLAPAYPAQGRIVRNGWLEVADTDRRVYLPSLVGGHPRIRWFDAATEEDLARIARDALSSDSRPLLVGSAGLARELAVLLSWHRPSASLENVGRAPSPAHRPPGRCLADLGVGLRLWGAAPRLDASGRRRAGITPCCPMDRRNRLSHVVFVIGSTNPVTLAQVDYLKARHPDAEVTTVAGLSKARKPGALVLSGGDTALEACRALGALGIRLEYEVLPGIPRGTLIGGPHEGLTVVTKAGGFGAVDALAAILEAV